MLSLRRTAGYVQRDFIAEPLKDRCQQTVQLLQDIHLMMHADYFIGALPNPSPPPFRAPCLDSARCACMQIIMEAERF